ncbi:hypothetical protein [Burkholderia ubonensis]|uniref:hypothetical protein n=1 Tax=Burkholderia ubonensis TaxID=101571 RepID=UPI0018DF7811|nr:hypothetical protein [Burkholderia ubonensis]
MQSDNVRFTDIHMIASHQFTIFLLLSAILIDILKTYEDKEHFPARPPKTRLRQAGTGLRRSDAEKP